jgi:hypothetical protein
MKRHRTHQSQAERQQEIRDAIANGHTTYRSIARAKGWPESLVRYHCKGMTGLTRTPRRLDTKTRASLLLACEGVGDAAA